MSADRRSSWGLGNDSPAVSPVGSRWVDDFVDDSDDLLDELMRSNLMVVDVEH